MKLNEIENLDDIKIICYSCGRGEYPENTIEGIRNCQKVNPDWRIEMDIQLTRDNKLILFHDYTTGRTTELNKPINEMTYSELKKLNAGYWFERNGAYPFRASPVRIPELRNVFMEFPFAKLLLDIHTNDPKVIELFIDLVDSYFLNGDFIVVSEYDDIISKFKKLKPEWLYGVPSKEAKKMLYSSFLYLDDLFPIKGDILMLPKKYGKINVLSKRVINHAKNRNKPIWAWMYEGKSVETVNSLSELKSLHELGVSGAFSDTPQKLFNELYHS